MLSYIAKKLSPKHLTDHTVDHIFTLPFVALVLFPIQYGYTELQKWVKKEYDIVLSLENILPAANDFIAFLFNFYLHDHPFYFIAGAFVLHYLLKLGRAVPVLLTANAKYKLMLSRVGLSHTWSDDDIDKGEAWGHCQEKISGTTDLRILGATGWKTFGKSDSPLHDFLKSYTGNVYILLADPTACSTADRIKSLDTDRFEYLLEIRRSLLFLAKLQAKTSRVEVKLYNQPLIWKMIIAGDFLWLQHYKDGYHVDATPIYGYESSAGIGLYDPLYSVFKKRWEKDSLTTFPLDKASIDSLFNGLLLEESDEPEEFVPEDS